MRDEVFKTLENRWRELYDQYQTIREPALSQVIRWEWANRPRYDPRPFHFLINPPRGRVLKQPPQDDRQKVYQYEYGLDAEGRVIVCNYSHSETYYTYLQDRIEATTFTEHKGRHELRRFMLCHMELGRMVYSANLELPFGYRGEGTAGEIWTRLSAQKYAIGDFFEEYVYERDQLVEIQENRGSAWWKFLEGKNRIEYDQKGRLKLIFWVKNDGTDYRVIYRKREPGETLASITEEAKLRLLKSIPETVAKAHFGQPLYCLNLNYSNGGRYFPPELLYSFEHYRQKQQATLPKPSWYEIWDIWNVHETGESLNPPLHITDENTLGACERLNLEITMYGRASYAQKMFYEIARQLNQLDWSAFAPVTSDFIVYACRFSYGMDTNILLELRKSGATKAQIADWRERGLL